jgi:hypothetical protein
LRPRLGAKRRDVPDDHRPKPLPRRAREVIDVITVWRKHEPDQPATFGLAKEIALHRSGSSDQRS